MNDLTYILDAAVVGVRLDKVLVTLQNDLSRHEIQQLIKAGHITVNGKRIKQNYKAKLADEVIITLPEIEQQIMKAEQMKLNILYEDDYIIVLDKAKGLLIHPTHRVKENTLVNGLLHHSAALSTLNGEERAGIVHRLDQDTSGVLVVAKDDRTHADLQAQFKSQEAIRIYEAIVYDGVPHNAGIIKAPIGRNPKNRMKMAVVEDGKASETHFTVLERFQQYTHLQCELKTGRTHQIRVHLKYMNHPIIGDKLYTRKKSKYSESQALFAKKLVITHPHTKEKMTFEIDRPAYFEKILQKLRTRT